MHGCYGLYQAASRSESAEDMLHLCEALARRGFVCAAPDFAEGLSGAVPIGEATRLDIVQVGVSRAG